MNTVRRFITLALSFVGLFDSLYLWWVYTSPSHPLVCLGTGCDVARASVYSHLWGLPLPFYGAAMYGALAILAFAEALSGRVIAIGIRYAILAISAAGFVVSVVLSGIEAFRLHAWCAWCLLSAIVVTLILILAVSGIHRPSALPESAAVLNAVRGQFVLFIVALAIGVPAFVHLARSGEFAPAKSAAAAILNERLVRPGSHATGDLASPVTVVEFGDFECPICKLAQKSVEQMLGQFGGRIRFVFRQFPMSGVDRHMHPQAEKAAEASECAGAQGKFWQAEKLFYQKQPDLSVPALESYASQLGLNAGQYDQCVSSGKMAARVHQDFEDGWAAGVRATPTFFVGHEMIEGPPNYSYLSQLIGQQLAASPAAAIPSGKTPNSATARSSIPFAATAPLPALNPFGQIQQTNPLACSANEARMQQPALIRTPQAKKLFEGNPPAVFVDVRDAQQFAAGHIARAINIPVEEIEQEWTALPKNKMIVLYEGGEGGGSPDDVCAFSRAAGRVLLLNGFSKANIWVYQDGLKGWKAAGLPVAP